MKETQKTEKRAGENGGSEKEKKKGKKRLIEEIIKESR